MRPLNCRLRNIRQYLNPGIWTQHCTHCCQNQPNPGAVCIASSPSPLGHCSNESLITCSVFWADVAWIHRNYFEISLFFPTRVSVFRVSALSFAALAFSLESTVVVFQHFFMIGTLLHCITKRPSICVYLFSTEWEKIPRPWVNHWTLNCQWWDK